MQAGALLVGKTFFHHGCYPMTDIGKSELERARDAMCAHFFDDAVAEMEKFIRLVARDELASASAGGGGGGGGGEDVIVPASRFAEMVNAANSVTLDYGRRVYFEGVHYRADDYDFAMKILRQRPAPAHAAPEAGGEKAGAIQFANLRLDEPYEDPDSDVSVLARQFLRAAEALRDTHARIAELERAVDDLASGTIKTLPLKQAEVERDRALEQGRIRHDLWRSASEARNAAIREATAYREAMGKARDALEIPSIAFSYAALVNHAYSILTEALSAPASAISEGREGTVSKSETVDLGKVREALESAQKALREYRRASAPDLLQNTPIDAQIDAALLTLTPTEEDHDRT